MCLSFFNRAILNSLLKVTLASGHKSRICHMLSEIKGLGFLFS